MSEPMFCRYCGKPLVNGECSCEEFQKAKMKAANSGAADAGTNTNSTGSSNTFSAEAAKQAFNGMKDKVVNIVDNEGKQINADNDSIYERNIPIVPNCVQPEKDEVMIRQYNIAILRTRLKFMRAEGRLEVTNKRVLFRAAGKCTKGPVLQEHELKLDEIGGIEIHSDYKFSLMNFFLFILLEVLILLPSISTTMAASAYDYYGGNRGGSTAVAVLCAVLGFAAAAGSVYMKRISIISDLLVTCRGIDVLLHDLVGENTEWFSAVSCSCVMDLPDCHASYQQSCSQPCSQDQDERRKWSSCDWKPEGDIQKKIWR